MHCQQASVPRVQRVQRVQRVVVRVAVGTSPGAQLHRASTFTHTHATPPHQVESCGDLVASPSFDASACSDLLSGCDPLLGSSPIREEAALNKKWGHCDDAASHVWAIAPKPSLKNPLPPSEQRRRTRLVVLVIILAFALIGIVSWVTLIGTADKAITEGITEASTETSKSQQAKDDRNAPREVTPGKAFTVGKHKTLAGWKVEQDTSLDDAMFNVTGKVKNIS